jgi:transposase-like protein
VEFEVGGGSSAPSVGGCQRSERSAKIEGGTTVKETVDAREGVSERALSPAVQEALGELVGVAREGLLALSVGVGLGVMAELMEEEVTEIVGPKGRHDRDRVAVRHGYEDGEVTLGGRRVPVSRPRVRAVDGSGEMPLGIYRRFASRDLLGQVVMERMLASVSCRRYQGTNEPVGGEVAQSERSTSKSAVSRTFIDRTRTALAELLARRLKDVRLAVLMLDGIDLKERTHVVALGITTQGVKIPLGLWEGSTENATVATNLLADLVERGLDPEQAILFVLDGAKALRKAVRSVFGEAARVQRCIRHKERNVTDHLAERDRPALKRRLRAAWALDDYDTALSRLQAIGVELERTHPGAASLREGLEETLTLQALKITGSLKKTLASTNPIESMIEIVRRTQRNVKRWQSGDMALRWTAAGMGEAERQFRRIIGYKQLARLVEAIERQRPAPSTNIEEAATLIPA